MKLPNVFLSLSGHDDQFVAKVHKRLPDGLAHFYPQSFKNGEELISAMESRIQESSLFALFVSAASVESRWVHFEIDSARLALIKGQMNKILVVPIDGSTNLENLPAWMRNYWIDNIGRGAEDIARYIRRELVIGSLGKLAGQQIQGRGELSDKAKAQIAKTIIATESTPNIIILAGNTGIGRRTFAHKLLAEAFSASPKLAYGPELQLPQFADIADIYRSLRQEIESGLSYQAIGEDVKKFSTAPTDEQASEIAKKISYYGDLGQGVTIVTGNGLFEDKGALKAWAPSLFRELEKFPKAKLVVVSNRLIHDNELRAHSNILQLQVPPIDDEHIKTLMVDTMSALGTKPTLPSTEIIRSIGGHPGIARATAALVAKKGPIIIDNDPRDIFALQEEVLGESLNFDDLSDIEKDTLSILSWVPKLDGNLLRQVIQQQHNVNNIAFAESTSGLMSACLVDASGTNFLISNPVRALFRRLHGYGSTDLRQALSRALTNFWEQAKEQNDLRAEIVDAIAYMTALEGGTLPPEFASLILPSAIQEIVRDTYDQNHDNEDELKRLVSWGLPTKTLSMNETTREEILSYVVRAQTRLGDEQGAEALLNFFDERRYRSRFYLRAFYIRLHKRDHEAAIPLLLEAKTVRKYMGRVVGELASCYQRLGKWPELQNLVDEQEQYVSSNPVLLNVHIGMLIARRDFNRAEIAINTLRSHPRQDAAADCRIAMIMMRRDRNFRGAKNLLSERLERGSAGRTDVRRLRASAAALSGDFAMARSDAAYLKARDPNYQAYDIEARIKLAEDDFDGAIEELNKKLNPSVQDQLLRAEIWEAKSNSPATAYSDRERLRHDAIVIRERYKMLDSYEVEF